MRSREARNIDPARIEEAGLNALQTQRQLFYDGWLLRLSPGSAKRARSVSAHFGSTLPLVDKIAYCEAVYRRCELPLLFRLTPFSQPTGLEDALVQRGYVAFDSTLVQAIRLDAPPSFTPGSDEVEVHAVDAATFTEAAGVLRGSDARQRDAHYERLRQSPLQSRLVVLRAQGVTVGTAQMAGEGNIAGMFDVVIAEEARGRGYASAAVAKLLVWAWEHAFDLVYLQVNATNAPAIALYRKFGFNTVYTYHYLGVSDAAT